MDTVPATRPNAVDPEIISRRAEDDAISTEETEIDSGDETASMSGDDDGTQSHGSQQSIRSKAQDLLTLLPCWLFRPACLDDSSDDTVEGRAANDVLDSRSELRRNWCVDDTATEIDSGDATASMSGDDDETQSHGSQQSMGSKAEDLLTLLPCFWLFRPACLDDSSDDTVEGRAANDVLDSGSEPRRNWCVDDSATERVFIPDGKKTHLSMIVRWFVLYTTQCVAEAAQHLSRRGHTHKHHFPSCCCRYLQQP